MKLIDNQNGIEVYDLEKGYRVVKEVCSWVPRGYMLHFYADNKYLPEIFDRANRDKKQEFAFRIQTASFGSLPPEEIKAMTSGYQAALDAIRMVEETFGKKKKL